jgi:hypothetical protein
VRANEQQKGGDEDLADDNFGINSPDPIPRSTANEGGEERTGWWSKLLRGLGISANKQVSPEEKEKMLSALGAGPTDLRTNAEGMGYTELASAVQRKLDSMDGPNGIHFLEEIYDDFFVYRVSYNEQSHYFKRSYSVQDDGVIVFGEDPQPVRKSVTYEPVNNAQPVVNEAGGEEIEEKGGITNMTDTKKGCCPERVEALITNEKSPFVEADREWLSTLNEESLAKVEMARSQETEEPEHNSAQQPTGNSQQKAHEGGQEAASSVQSAEEFLTNAEMPEDVKAVLSASLNERRQKKTSLIEQIKANQNNPFTDEQLQRKEPEELSQIAHLMQPDKAKDSGKVWRGPQMGVNSQQKPTTNVLDDEPLVANTKLEPVKKAANGDE